MNLNDPALLAFVQQEAKKIATEVYQTQATQFGVANTSVHQHTGIDTVTIPASSITETQNLSAAPGGVLDKKALGGQVVIQGAGKNNYNSSTTVKAGVVTMYPNVVISGGGNSTTYTLTGTPAAGATTATLTAPYAGPTATLATAFSSTEIKAVTYTFTSTTISWATGLQYGAGGTSISQNGDSTFNGGDAPIGTLIIFANAESLLPQYWVRVDIPANTDKWYEIASGSSIVGFTT